MEAAEAAEDAEAAREAAEAAREAGNALFKAQSYAEASLKYVDAMEQLQKLAWDGKAPDAAVEKARMESLHKCRLNRAACLMKLQGYRAAQRECEAVLQDDNTNAKAHFRLGQACEALGELGEARERFTAAIKASPQDRAPRDALDALKARLKAQPNLENIFADLKLVEERAFQALHFADLPRARQQMELLLKDARAHKEVHWEARALLALALLCSEEGETEAADDYMRSATRVACDASDRRAMAYANLAAASIALDAGDTGMAFDELTPGLLLAEELGELQLATRFLTQLAAAHAARMQVRGPPPAEGSNCRPVVLPRAPTASRPPLTRLHARRDVAAAKGPGAGPAGRGAGQGGQRQVQRGHGGVRSRPLLPPLGADPPRRRAPEHRPFHRRGAGLLQPPLGRARPVRRAAPSS